MTNVQYLRYAVEIEKTGSISRAAENLYMSQPQLSKALRELERELGIPLFNRTSKGVVPTSRGVEYLRHAKRVLAQLEAMEALYKPVDSSRQTLDVDVPRASYISYAFTEFVRRLNHDKDIDVRYRETHSMKAISEVYESVVNLAVIRYPKEYSSYFLEALNERELKHRRLWEFRYLALMSRNHPLADGDVVDGRKLMGYTEITHGDMSIPSLPVTEARALEQSRERHRRIEIYERGSQFELLSRVQDTYMWVSPVPQEVLDRFELVQKPCCPDGGDYIDELIYRKGYPLSAQDTDFIERLYEAVTLVSGGDNTVGLPDE